MEEILIRRFEEKDVDECFKLTHKSLNSNRLLKVYDKETVDLWNTYYSKEYILGMAKLRHVYVALIDNHVVGNAAISLDQNMGYLSFLYVDPDYQGRGIAKKLFNALENDEIAEKTKKVYMHAALSANTLYQKLGYKYKDDKPEIVMDAALETVYLEKEL